MSPEFWIVEALELNQFVLSVDRTGLYHQWTPLSRIVGQVNTQFRTTIIKHTYKASEKMPGVRRASQNVIKGMFPWEGFETMNLGLYIMSNLHVVKELRMGQFKIVANCPSTYRFLMEVRPLSLQVWYVLFDHGGRKEWLKHTGVYTEVSGRFRTLTSSNFSDSILQNKT